MSGGRDTNLDPDTGLPYANTAVSVSPKAQTGYSVTPEQDAAYRAATPAGMSYNGIDAETGLPVYHHDDGGGFLGQLGNAVGSVLTPQAVMAIGLTLATAGAGASLGASLMESGLLTSAEAASSAVLAAGGTEAAATAAAAAATNAATTVGTVIANSGLSIARGVPPEKALENGALSLLASQYVTPEISAEVKSVISSPLGQQMATNAGTAAVMGTISGQSPDQIGKAIVGSATGTLAGAAGAEVGSQVLGSIDDPTIAKIAADAASAATKSGLLGQDPARAALNAGATTLAHSDLGDLGLGDTFSGITSNLPTVDLSGIKDALQPVSDATTSVLQPLEQPIKDVAQAGSDAATRVLQPLEQPIKDVAQAGSDAVTSVLQPVGDAISSAVGNLPTVDLPSINIPKINLPKLTGNLPTVTASAAPASTGALPTFNYTDPAAAAGKLMTVGKMGSDMTEHQLKQLYAGLTDMPSTAYNYVNDVNPETLNIAQLESQPFQQPAQPMYARGGLVHLADGGQPDDVMSALKSLGAIGFDSKVASPKLLQQGQMGGSYAPKVLPQLAALLQSRGMHLADGGQPGDDTHPNYDGTPLLRTGGLSGLGGKYVEGKGDGTSDDIAAMLANGEYVFSADVVAALGNGSNKAGAENLDEMVKAIRARARSAPPDKLPPDAKSPLEYLKSSKGKKNG
jgi:hypothetical protein